MTTKSEWIRQQSVALGETNANSLYSKLQDLVEIPNPAQPYKVPKPINLTEIVNPIAASDVLILYRDYGAIVDAILVNINKSALGDVANLIKALTAPTSTLSTETKEYLATTFADIQSSYLDPETYGVEVTPPATIKVTRYAAAGYESLTYQEVVDALNS